MIICTLVVQFNTKIEFMVENLLYKWYINHLSLKVLSKLSNVMETNSLIKHNNPNSLYKSLFYFRRTT